ncbi:SIMPL domain-containing protein [Desulfuribacillus stibiiarsenatis]|uniref:SIMPL domain-containing protein n=1 Tax=Desulfuribacillus stibiiarsenatis TaxID=1390249 RepID=UPI00159F34B1|nr:SIMPL domain-containing protein [Desulfuribacillus stibiiarsenatis]
MLFSHFSEPANAEVDGKSGIPVVNVGGVGEIFVEPDAAKISIGVVTTAKTAEQAQKDNAQAANRVMTALAAAGIDKKQIQTQNYSVYPQYDYSINRNGQAEIIGYQARNMLLVDVKSIDKLGAIIDKASQAGANEVNNVQFYSTKEEVLRSQALTAAVQDAAKKADVVAAALNKKVADVVSISTDSASVTPPVFYAPEMAKMAGDASTPIMTGEIVIRASVQAQFNMK